MARVSPTRVTAGLPGLTPTRRLRRDTILRTREHEKKAAQESIERDKATVAPDGEIDTTNSMAQLGHPLSAHEIENRLKKANPNLVFERSINFPDKIGIYIVRRQNDPIMQTSELVKEHVMGMEAGVSPEFSVRHYTTERVPDPDPRMGWTTVKKFTKETRGWRSVLARLLRSRLINQADIDRYFNPAYGRDSKNWKLLTT